MKVAHGTGKRKRAIARATITEGKGRIKINNKALDSYNNTIIRLKIEEPLILAGNVVNNIDIGINVMGGGIASQADAVRLAIARALVEYTKDKKLEETFLKYDRQLLVADVRRKEVCKPNDSKARKKRQKSYR